MRVRVRVRKRKCVRKGEGERHTSMLAECFEMGELSYGEVGGDLS